VSGNDHHIHIGNQTAWSAEEVDDPFTYALAHSFDAFEWFPDKKDDGYGWEVIDILPRQRSAIRKLAKQHNIRLSVHTTNGITPDDPRWLSTLDQDLIFAEDIGAHILNIHIQPENGVEAFADSLKQLYPLLDLAKCRLAIENTPISTPDHFNHLFSLIGEQAHEGISIGMCIDIGHANLCQATLNDYLGFIDALDPSIPIIHAHLHENHGDYDQHLPLFTGPSKNCDAGLVGFVSRMVNRDYRGSFILEQWPHPHSLLDQAAARLNDIISDQIYHPTSAQND